MLFTAMRAGLEEVNVVFMEIHNAVTFMHLADAFVQSDLYCMQGTHIFISVLAS